MSEHTPGPWRVRGRTKIRGTVLGMRYKIADVCYPESGGEYERRETKANAEFIVRACNAHEELVAAVDAAARYFEARNLGEPAHELQARLVAALAKAEGDA